MWHCNSRRRKVSRDVTRTPRTLENGREERRWDVKQGEGRGGGKGRREWEKIGRGGRQLAKARHCMNCTNAGKRVYGTHTHTINHCALAMNNHLHHTQTPSLSHTHTHTSVHTGVHPLGSQGPSPSPPPPREPSSSAVLVQCLWSYAEVHN